MAQPRRGSHRPPPTPAPTRLSCLSRSEVVARYHPLALRWFLTNTQYRQPINYTQRALEEVRGRRGWGVGWAGMWTGPGQARPSASAQQAGGCPAWQGRAAGRMRHPASEVTHALSRAACDAPHADHHSEHALQASDRLYYLYQTLADAAELLSASPEGQAALAEAQQLLEASTSAGAPQQQAQQQEQQQQQQQAEQQQQQQLAGSGGKGGGNGGGKGSKGKAAASPGAELLAEVLAALADDINTPLAIAALSAPLKTANDLLHTKAVSCQPSQPGVRPWLPVWPGWEAGPDAATAAPACHSHCLLSPNRPAWCARAAGQEGTRAAAGAGQPVCRHAVQPGPAGPAARRRARTACGAAGAGAHAVRR